ncbi:hypothetical protein J7E88_01885 [Streptomyces sp. ISL-10]|uniref:hypothetical protein n=1 Tax=Streptomyces sp. ISL-10 TaxID=2819172 RepID=UPI001BEAB751|nr:hypothetical protein [Streptomyces sp. ISL-10]MBT2364112.1 hypothetical protein [Streptomyces sp. ISL-10]
MNEHESYCETSTDSGTGAGPAADAGPGEAFAECVLCREPTEYPASVKGAPLCPVCEWREAERSACSG